MEAFSYEILLGAAFGLLVGLVLALLLGVFTLAANVVRDRRLSAATGVAIALPLAVIATLAIGPYSELADTSYILRSGVAAIIVGLLAAVATSQGNRVADELPSDTAGTLVRGQTLSSDAIDAVDAIGQVTIRSTGTVRELEGYPSLAPGLRTILEDGSWRFPADLQLIELERRLECRLRTDYELASVSVSIDGRGRATISAAPAINGLASNVPEGTRAVTVSGLFPVGVESGDAVSLDLESETVDGTVLTVDDQHGFGRRFGGDGRLTVAVPTTDAGAVIASDNAHVSVRPRGINAEYEAITLLERAGRSIVAVDCEEVLSETADSTDGEADVLAVRSRAAERIDRDWEWSFEVDDWGSVALADGDRLFVVDDGRRPDGLVGELLAVGVEAER